MHTYILSLGSNDGDRAHNLAAALDALAPFLTGRPEVSDIIETPSVTGFGAPYLNLAARVVTDLEPAELQIALRHSEAALGRTPGSKAAGQIPIDIDIVIADGHILRPADYHTPHFQLCYAQLTQR